MKLSASMLGTTCLLLALSAWPQENAKPVFSPGENAGEIRFDTGVLRGLMREKGTSVGVNPAEYIANGQALAKWPGLMDYYRVFTTSHRHVGGMREVPSTAEITAPDTLRVHWEPGDDRPFALTVTYHWSAPDTLDVETVAEAKASLPDFEIFTSSYTVEHFPATMVYAKQADGKAEFIPASEEAGVWQMFPRDAAGVKLIQDGRWAIPPSPVEWAIRPEFAVPLLYRRDPESKLTLAVMARPQDCFAVATPKSGEAHYSMYLSLFGRTLAEGETVRARNRLVIAPMDDAGVLARYEAFIRACAEEK